MHRRMLGLEMNLSNVEGKGLKKRRDCAVVSTTSCNTKPPQKAARIDCGS